MIKFFIRFIKNVGILTLNFFKLICRILCWIFFLLLIAIIYISTWGIVIFEWFADRIYDILNSCLDNKSLQKALSFIPLYKR